MEMLVLPVMGVCSDPAGDMAQTYIPFLKCKNSEFGNTPEPKGFRWQTMALRYNFLIEKGKKESFLEFATGSLPLSRNSLTTC